MSILDSQESASTFANNSPKTLPEVLETDLSLKIVRFRYLWWKLGILWYIMSILLIFIKRAKTLKI